MGAVGKQSAKVSEFVQSSLAPDERVVGVLPYATKGPSVWWYLLTSWVMFLQTPYSIVVTDRRLLVVRLRRTLTGYPPKAIEGDYPLGAVGVRVQRGSVTSRLSLDRPGAGSLSLTVGRIYRDAADEVAAASRPQVSAASA